MAFGTACAERLVNSICGAAAARWQDSNISIAGSGSLASFRVRRASYPFLGTSLSLLAYTTSSFIEDVLGYIVDTPRLRIRSLGMHDVTRASPEVTSGCLRCEFDSRALAKPW